ncbi:MAG: 4Fe-4S dicluster domain-containing protein [Acidobacteriota bacterium]
MQTLRMNESLLPSLLEVLKGFGTLIAPVERSPGVFSLEAIADVSRVRPDALRTILPFKKLLLKPGFVMLEQRAGGAPVESRDNDWGPLVYFGAHSCDIHALKILDLLYLSDYVDPYYKRNRDNLTVVGYGCMPDDKCFCKSVGTATVDENFDLFLTPLQGRFMVTVASARGDDIVRTAAHLFEPATRRDVQDFLDRVRERDDAFTLTLDVADLPYVLELKTDDPVWEELGKKCLCCGSCSMVCPTCACFNVRDEIPEEGTVRRVRTWDACLYREYAQVAGGHNFRDTRADRVRNRYYHKQEAFVREFGMPSCVGCGRCIENCPTGINVVEVFQTVRGEL